MGGFLLMIGMKETEGIFPEQSDLYGICSGLGREESGGKRFLGRGAFFSAWEEKLQELLFSDIVNTFEDSFVFLIDLRDGFSVYGHGKGLPCGDSVIVKVVNFCLQSVIFILIFLLFFSLSASFPLFFNIFLKASDILLDSFYCRV